MSTQEIVAWCYIGLNTIIAMMAGWSAHGAWNSYISYKKRKAEVDALEVSHD